MDVPAALYPALDRAVKVSDAGDIGHDFGLFRRDQPNWPMKNTGVTGSCSALICGQSSY
jgi:hypothetical protein